MADRTVTVTLTAKDGMSSVFQAAARSGEQLEASLKRAADGSTRAFDEVGQSVTETARAFLDVGNDARSASDGVEALASSTADAAGAFGEIGGAAADVRMVLGDLAETYNLTSDQLNMLSQEMANFANESGQSVAQVAAQVEAAVAGETAAFQGLSAELQGIVGGLQMVGQAQADVAAGVGDTSAAMQTLAAGANEATAAQASLSERVAQVRTEFVQSHRSAVAVDRGIRGVSSSVREMATELTGAGSALTRVATGLETGVRIASRFTTAVGAVGLAGAAIFAASEVIKLIGSLEGTEKAAEAASKAMASVTDSIIGMGQSGAQSDLHLFFANAADSMSDLLLIAGNAQGQINDIIADWQSIISATPESPDFGMMLDPDQLALFAEFTGRAIDRNGDMVISLQEVEAAINAMIDTSERLNVGTAAWEAFTTSGADGINKFAEILKRDTPAARDAIREIMQLFSEIEAGVLGPGALEAGLDTIWDDFIEDSKAAALAGEEAIRTAGQMAVAFGLVSDQRRVDGHVRKEAIALAQEESRQFDNAIVQLKDRVAAQQEAAAATELTGQAWTDAAAAGLLFGERVLGQAEAWQQAEEARKQYRLDQVSLAWGEVAAAAQTATTVMDDTFRVIVGNTDAIRDQVGEIFDWADALIAAEGVWSRLDELLMAGTISGEHGVFTGDSDYARAQQAYNQIAIVNEGIDLLVDTIQAKTAPALAEATVMAEAFLREIAQMEPMAMLAALGFADTAKSAQALDLVLAGLNLGLDGSSEAFQDMIVNASYLDPVLAAMYESLGLINIETDALTGEKTITFNEEGLDQLSSGTTALTEALNNLTDTLYQVFILGDASNAFDAIGSADAALRNLDGRTATLGIGADASAFWAVFNGLPTQVSIGAQFLGIGSFLPHQRGVPHQHGGVVGARHGRVLGEAGSWVGESGPELMIGGQGAIVIPSTASLQGAITRGDEGTSVSVAGMHQAATSGDHIEVTVNLTVHEAANAEEISESIADALEVAIRRRKAGQPA
jgi:hypothetical protein